MALLNEKDWSSLTHKEKDMLKNREWDLEALTFYGNMVGLYEQSTSRQVNWLIGVVEQFHEDEIVWGEELSKNNQDNQEFVDMFASCEFANGKELTGNLEEYIMNSDNNYTR